MFVGIVILDDKIKDNDKKNGLSIRVEVCKSKIGGRYSAISL